MHSARRWLRPLRAARRTHWTYWVAAVLLGVALWQFGQGAYIHAKARLAQYLIAAAWTRTLAGEAHVKPWPWADTWPIARLRVPRLNVDLYVLAGASGRTLAFGPGHLDGTAAPGAAGNSVLAAHRDTHFAFLAALRPGDEILVDTPVHRSRRYVVVDHRIVDEHDLRVLQPNVAPQLTLVTCYPFDAVRPGGPLRYVVQAAVRGSLLARR